MEEDDGDALHLRYAAKHCAILLGNCLPNNYRKVYLALCQLNRTFLLYIGSEISLCKFTWNDFSGGLNPD